MSTIFNEDDQQPKAKSSLEARREARIKKILENSKTRLEKLNGEVVPELKEKVIYPDPEVESWEYVSPPSPEPMSNFSGGANPNDLFSAFLGSGMGGNMETDLNPDLENFAAQFFQSANLQSSPNPATTSPPPKFLQFKFHIILMAVVTYLLFYTGNEKYVCYSVLFPLLLWELTEMFLMKAHQKPSPAFLNIAFMFLKVSPTYSNLLVKTFETFNKVFNDVGVFMFSFSLIHLALAWNTVSG